MQWSYLMDVIGKYVKAFNGIKLYNSYNFCNTGLIVVRGNEYCEFYHSDNKDCTFILNHYKI